MANELPDTHGHDGKRDLQQGTSLQSFETLRTNRKT